MKRVFYFLATNLAILLLLGVVLSIFGRDGRSTGSTLVIAALFGMGASFISLAMSKWIAKRSTGAWVLDDSVSETERWLVDTVRHQASQAGIGTPEVAVYDSPEINAIDTSLISHNEEGEGGLAGLLMSHPPLEQRIAALRGRG